MATQEQLALRSKWIAALRSGKYQQTQGVLRGEVGYCCLGVACDVFAPGAWEKRDGEIGQYFRGLRDQAPPSDVVDAFGFRNSIGHFANPEPDAPYSLINANDSANWTFRQIADFAEQHPEQVFID